MIFDGQVPADPSVLPQGGEYSLQLNYEGLKEFDCVNWLEI